MEQAKHNGLVFNEEKYAIGTSDLPFFELVFDKDGVHPNKNRIEAIKFRQYKK